jgi:hypothetical protein
MRAPIAGAFAAAILALAPSAGCGSAAPATNLAHFTGPPQWDGSLSSTGTCSNGSTLPIIPKQGQFTFVSNAANEIEYTTSDGCLFKFNVSLDTATLSNAPVKCSTVILGASIALTFTQYTATTTDGHHLTGTVSYSTQAGSITCNFTGNGSATR